MPSPDLSPIHVRSITRSDAWLFASLSEQPERTEAVLIQLWDEYQSCPEWCFIAETGGKPIARLGFWMLPSITGVFHLSWLELPWHEDYLNAGKALWNRSIAQMKGYGAESVEADLDSDARFHDRRDRFYEHVGMKLLQEKIEYVLPTGIEPVADAGRLVFRDLIEVGADAFLGAIAQVTRGTLDREDQFELARTNPEDIARRYFGILQDIDYTPERWQLAYRPDGELVGLVAPQMLNDEVGAINYIGVVPALRGQGYVNDLLAQGTRLLETSGAKKVIASIDRLNAPMEAAVIRAGFKRDVGTGIYRQDLCEREKG